MARLFIKKSKNQKIKKSKNQKIKKSKNQKIKKSKNQKWWQRLYGSAKSLPDLVYQHNLGAKNLNLF
ncbi:hypothetical protein [Pseudoalteromonas rhizosphaerae]|uniref:Uncharacterized protein n=1 Tax=Pseudoalteromonas rhizosphaerae TaxID=2518973 RepID=A0ABW8KXC9_9GAMM